MFIAVVIVLILMVIGTSIEWFRGRGRSPTRDPMLGRDLMPGRDARRGRAEPRNISVIRCPQEKFGPPSGSPFGPDLGSISSG